MKIATKEQLIKLIDNNISRKEIIEDVNNVNEFWNILLVMFGDRDGDIEDGGHITREVAEEVYDTIK